MITKEKLLPALLTIQGNEKRYKVRAQTEPIRKGRSQTGLLKFELLVGGSCLYLHLNKELDFSFEFQERVTLPVRGMLKFLGLNVYVIETVDCSQRGN